MVLVVLVFIWPPSTGRPVRLNDQLNDGSKKNEMKWNVNENEQQNKPIHLRENFFFKFISYLTNMWMREIKIVAREWRKKNEKRKLVFCQSITKIPYYNTNTNKTKNVFPYTHTHTQNERRFFWGPQRICVFFMYLFGLYALAVCVCMCKYDIHHHLSSLIGFWDFFLFVRTKSNFDLFW